MERIKIATLNIAAASRERARKVLDDWVVPTSCDVYVLTETSEGEGTQLISNDFKTAGWTVYQEAGPQRSKGVTLDVVRKVTDHWNVWLAYGFTQAQVAGGAYFPIGNVLPEAARHLGNIWTTYDFSKGVLRGFGVGGGLQASTFKEGDLPNSYLLPGYARLDASIWYRIHRSNEKTSWRVSLNIKNALDRHYWEESNGGFARPGNPFAAYSSIRMTWD